MFLYFSAWLYSILVLLVTMLATTITSLYIYDLTLQLFTIILLHFCYTSGSNIWQCLVYLLQISVGSLIVQMTNVCISGDYLVSQSAVSGLIRNKGAFFMTSWQLLIITISKDRVTAFLIRQFSKYGSVTPEHRKALNRFMSLISPAGVAVCCWSQVLAQVIQPRSY